MKKKSNIALFLAFVVLLVFGAYFITQEDAEIFEFTLADADQPAFSLFYLAEDLGYFEDENVRITYKQYSSGRDALDSVISGESDLGTVFETPVVVRYLEGSDITIVSELHSASNNVGLVARKDSGIDSIEDLNGMSLAYPSSTGAEFIAYTLIQEAVLEVDDVEWVEANPSEMVDLLVNAEVDAIAIWNPHIENAVSTLGEENVSVFFAEQIREYSMLAGLETYIEENEQGISQVLNALIRAEAFLLENPEISRSLLIDHFDSVDSETVHSILDKSELKIQLSPGLERLISEESVWFELVKGNFNRSMDLDAIIYTHILDSIDLDRVTVFFQ